MRFPSRLPRLPLLLLLLLPLLRHLSPQLSAGLSYGYLTLFFLAFRPRHSLTLHTLVNTHLRWSNWILFFQLTFLFDLLFFFFFAALKPLEDHPEPTSPHAFLT